MMHPSRCTDCLKAKTRIWAIYNQQCEGCLLRMIASLDEDGREREFDALERHYGPGARVELVRCVNEERARIRALEGVKA